MKKNTHTVEVTTGVLAGVLAAGAVAYLLLGPSGEKNREKMKTWFDEAKEKIVEQAKSLAAATQEEFSSIIDTVLEHYTTAKQITTDDALLLKNELMENWESLALLIAKGRYQEVELLVSDSLKTQTRTTLKKIVDSLLKEE